MLLVTGITGHSGRYFLQQLIDNNYTERIRCVVRKNSNIEFLKNIKLDIEIVVGDLNNTTFIHEIMSDIKTVIHIYNIHHSPKIVNAATDNKVNRVILVHTTGIYSKFKSASADYKRIETEVLEMNKEKTALTILRPTMIYGDMCDHNMSKFIKMINYLRIYPLINGGKGLLQPVNARDLGKAYYDVLMNPELTANKQYDLSGDEPISIKEALTLISKKLNKQTIFVSVPIGLSVFFANIINVITIGKINIAEKVLRMGEDRAYSHELAKNDFNYTTMTFDKGIEIEINEFKKTLKNR